ncbi:tripartite tricarboxylate transporter permease [Roseibaca sp. Y0-43]|uniref:tripartite tricarboxylate transporter permease n=1 Tax=Roseibaca sp. Y0-43 TaxID=2816854 RepID=UPI001D0C863F|nr:tripartite tricarboxylate transporter permease [Roseibaca sp. Y0-43]MCC1481159.1 tripartite tricarboxylate transporter permease [Roseibaca sp. Y0-43]
MDVALAALSELFEPLRLFALLMGVLAGMVFGMLPGLGGVAAVSIMLPFVFLFDNYAGLALLLGAISVVYTSDTITSVLLGAPGSPASAPTAIEGHAMAKRGEAATALGLGFLASMVGGLVGAITLALAIPVAGPIVLALGTPELLMFAMVGLYFASSMIGRDLAVGLAAGCLGLLIGTIGPAPAAANFRFTFGQAYLLDGLSLTIVALGLFAVPEIISMLSGGGGISAKKQVVSNWSAGFSEFWKSRWLILRSALIGTFGGFVPAVGANASTWVAYGHAMRSTKDKSRFGKGEPRGVAAAEGANNATVISDLVPTLLFSVPGGPAAAIFLGALFSFGFYPGPRMVTEEPVLLYLIVWSVALASIVGAAICFAITPMVAQLTRIRFALIAAPLMLVMIAGAYQATQSMGDIAMLLLLGVIGWIMKQAEWPRAPILVGFVLAKPVEQYFWLTTQIHGWTWLARPGVLLIASFIVFPLLWRGWTIWREKRGSGETVKNDDIATPPAVEPAGTSAARLAMAGLGVLIFGYALFEVTGFRANARLLPLLAIVPGLALAIFVLVREMRRFLSHRDLFHVEAKSDYPIIALLLGYAFGIALVGFQLATAAFLLLVLIRFAGMRLLGATLYAAVLFLGINGLFTLMRITPPEGILIASLF